LKSNSPIGVFDSGLGGLSVLKVLARNFPNENFLYLGDTARLPYGSKSPETIRQYTEQTLNWLSDRGCKALIIACNTASSQFQESEFAGKPVYNVIGPGSEAALSASKSKVIGVLGTRATIQSQIYNQKIQSLDSTAHVLGQACPLFVPLSEEGWTDDPVTNLIAFRYLQGLRSQARANEMDTVILGCTHYPFLRAPIQKALGNEIHLVESGEVLSAKLAEDSKNGLWKAQTEKQNATVHLASTDRSVFFENLAQQFLAPQKAHEFELVNL